MSTNKLRLKLLLGKIESTYGVDAVPTPTDDAIQVEQSYWSTIELGYLEENLREDLAVQGMGRAGLATPTGAYAHIQVMVALKGLSSAFSLTNLPEADVLLRSAAMGRVDDFTPSTETLTYNPITSNHESATFYAYTAGSLYKVLGARSELTSITWTPGQLVIATFDIWGLLPEDPTDVALPTNVVYRGDDVYPPTVKNAALTMNSWTPGDFSNFTFEGQSNMQELPRGNAADGHAGYEVTDWNPQFTATVDNPPKASFDPSNLRRTGTLFPWSIGPVGAAQYNRIALDGPKGRITNTPHVDEDQLGMVDLVTRAQNQDDVTPDTSFYLRFT